MEGYQNTEIGLLPNEWDFGRIDDYFSVQQGKQVSKSNRNGENQKSFLRTSNILWGRIIFDELDHMHFSEQEEVKFQLEKNDLLVCEGGDIGRTAIWNNEVENCYYQNHLHRLRTKTNEIDPLFILQWLQYSFVYGKIYFGRGNDTTIPNLSKSRLSELIIPQPELPEQRKIAHVLSTVQKAIEQQDKLIRTTTELKKAIIQKLFTEGTRGEPQKETEIGFVPESWEVMKIGDVIKFSSGKLRPKNISKVKTDELIIPVYGGNGILGYSDKIFLKKTTLILGRVGEYCGCTHLTQGKSWITDNALYAKEQKRDVNLVFIKNCFEYLNLNQYSNKMGQPLITQGIINDVIFGLPPRNEQNEIADNIQIIDIKIEYLNKKKQTLIDLFKTLLHELMTGQRSVHELEFEKMEEIQ